MFRPTKKRPNKKRIITTSRNDESDEEDEQPQQEVAVKKPPKKRKKKQRQVVATMSFHVEDDDDEKDQKGRRHCKKSRKRKGGMGYGGAAAAAGVDMDVDEEESAQVVEPETASNSLYGKEALEALKSQQKYKTKTQQQKEQVPTETAQNDGMQSEKAQQDSSSSFLNESYIPFTNKDSQPLEQEPSVILTGDEAMTFGQEEEGATTTLEPTPSHHQFVMQETEETTESRAWEQEVVRRAGISQPKASTTTAAPTSLAAMKRQVQTTMTNLQTQQNDLQSAYHRRVADMERTTEELHNKQEELKTSASALEYYQELRQELASWVGALRELQKKVQPLQQAVLELSADNNHVLQQEQWQNDMIHILQSANLLENVVGRPVDIHVGDHENETHVDEFGRDVKSQKVLEREKRARQRQRIRQEWQQRQENNTTTMEEDSDAYCGTESQVVERRERRNALALALDIATQDFEEQYTSLSSLHRVFETWLSKYPEEDKQCFASLSLADLASVLIRVDLCAALDPLHWLDGQVIDNGNDNTMQSSSPQLYWLQDLKALGAADNNDEDETPIHKVLDNVLVPAVVDLLDKNAYNVVSARQSHSLARFCQELCDAASPNTKSISQLRNRVVQYLRQYLEHMSIPIVKADAINAATLNSSDEEVQEAITYATQGQVHRIKKLLVNILQYWVPVLGDLLMEPVLDFATSQFLFVLSSLQAQGMGDLGTIIFSKVWHTLKTHTQWMERSDVMLQAAPLRAAAVAYKQS